MGRQSLVGCHLWGRTESDTTEATQQQQQLTIWTSISKVTSLPFNMLSRSVIALLSVVLPYLSGSTLKPDLCSLANLSVVWPRRDHIYFAFFSFPSLLFLCSVLLLASVFFHLDSIIFLLGYSVQSFFQQVFSLVVNSPSSCMAFSRVYFVILLPMIPLSVGAVAHRGCAHAHLGGIPQSGFRVAAARDSAIPGQLSRLFYMSV